MFTDINYFVSKRKFLSLIMPSTDIKDWYMWVPVETPVYPALKNEHLIPVLGYGNAMVMIAILPVQQWLVHSHHLTVFLQVAAS